MNFSTLISAKQLQELMASGQALRVFDCSFDLTQPQLGKTQYLQAHIAGSVHADLDTALSARHGINPAKTGAEAIITVSGADAPASGGRHPLPNRERFATWLSSVGFANDMQAVVYDRNGANYCGRLWWMLKWAGHDKVALLDGGLQAWQAAGGALATGEEPAHFQANFLPGPPLARLVDASVVARELGRPAQTLMDARAPARFRGEVEPLDPVAGHIPGALNRPLARISDLMDCLNQRLSYGLNLHPCWANATPPRSSITAGAASAPCPTSWPWRSPAWDAQRYTPGAGATGAQTPIGPLPWADAARQSAH